MINKHLTRDEFAKLTDNQKNYALRYQRLDWLSRVDFDKLTDYQKGFAINQPCCDKSMAEKYTEVETYAQQHNLKIDAEYLYAYRNHSFWGGGIYRKFELYQPGVYYRDWHCDMRPREENSFGFGIWPKGNTPVRVKIEDWGVAVKRNDGKARVWGFEMMI